MFEAVAMVAVAAAAGQAAYTDYTRKRTKQYGLTIAPHFCQCEYCGRLPDVLQIRAQCESCGAPLVNEK